MFFPHSWCGQPSGDSNSSRVWKSVGPIVSQLPSKTGVERSNRPKAKVLQRNSLVVKIKGLQSASGAVWGRYKISSRGRNRENRPKHCTATTRLTIRSWVPCQPQAGACRDHWCRGAFYQGYVLLRRRWSPCVFMLWKAEGCCWGFSGAVLSKCARSAGCNCLMKIRMREQRSWNRVPRLGYSQRFSGF